MDDPNNWIEEGNFTQEYITDSIKVPENILQVHIDGEYIGKVRELGMTKMKNITTYTAKFELKNGQILEIPLPDKEWIKEKTHKCHRLTFISSTPEFPRSFQIFSPEETQGKGYITNHIEGQIWLKDMVRYIHKSHCIEITKWRKK